MRREPPPIVHPLDFAPDGLACCLKCRGVVRAVETGELLPIRTELRARIMRLYPDLVFTLLAPIQTFPGPHRC